MRVSIRVTGHVDPVWQDWLEGLAILHESGGTSLIYGTLRDQPALAGVLSKISQLSLALVSLDCVEPMPDETRQQV